MNQCRSCHADIRWASTTNGKPMPLDAEPNPDGNVELLSDGTAVVHGQTPMGIRVLYMPHHATCPQAAEWKGRR